MELADLKRRGRCHCDVLDRLHWIDLLLRLPLEIKKLIQTSCCTFGSLLIFIFYLAFLSGRVFRHDWVHLFVWVFFARGGAAVAMASDAEGCGCWWSVAACTSAMLLRGAVSGQRGYTCVIQCHPCPVPCHGVGLTSVTGLSAGSSSGSGIISKASPEARIAYNSCRKIGSRRQNSHNDDSDHGMSHPSSA